MHTCRRCGYKYDCHSEANGQNASPKEGDISICLQCGYLGEFRSGRVVTLPNSRYLALPEELKSYIAKIEKNRADIVEKFPLQKKEAG